MAFSSAVAGAQAKSAIFVFPASFKSFTSYYDEGQNAVPQLWKCGSTSLGQKRAGASIQAGNINRASSPRNQRRGPRASSSSSSSSTREEKTAQDYYGILGVAVGSSPADIRRAYWSKQKLHHPDIAGNQGHEMALLLNEAYNALMDDRQRAVFEGQWKTATSAGFSGFTGQPLSKWSGPQWPQGIFVDEASCIGCQECKHVAPNTFEMDPVGGAARVSTQWADPQSSIKVAIDACPVDCIHYVEREDLPSLEYLMRPRPRPSHGVHGGGWERLERGSVFEAARNFRARLKREEARAFQSAAAAEETPAQRAARKEADRKLNRDPFWWLTTIWNSSSFANGRSTEAQGSTRAPQAGQASGFGWPRTFATAGTSELLWRPVASADVTQTVAFVQEWATLWASSSELPLPLPFRTDLLPDGVVLTFVTATNGSLSSIGSMSICVTATSPPAAAPGLHGGHSATGGSSSEDDGWALVVRRQGTGSTKPLPGEGRLMKHLRDALERKGNAAGYEAYHLSRNAL
eukprot:jgi/Mesen1/5532/ME000279S04733